jgi:hypothetical protein
LKSTTRGGRVLCARTPTGIDQEVYALLTAYQTLRLAMADATGSVSAAGDDRASFTIALHTARDQVIHAAGVIAATTIDLVGKIGRAVLTNLLPPPARRPGSGQKGVHRARAGCRLVRGHDRDRHRCRQAPPISLRH